MKAKNLILTLALLATTLVAAQYSCSRFYPFQEGVKSTYTLQDETETFAGTVSYSIERVYEEDGKPTANMNYKMMTNNGIPISNATYKLMCEENGIAIDFNSFMPTGMMSMLGGRDADITGTDLVIPNDLNVGDLLPDGLMVVKVTVNSQTVVSGINFTEREVIGRETITTPAGTFDCYIIKHIMEVNRQSVYRTKSFQWISEGVGMVRQVDENMSGDVTGRIELNSIER